MKIINLCNYKNNRIELLFWSVLFCVGCKEKADLILHNATIYTAADTFQTAQAMAVANGKILAVGSNIEILGDYTAAHVIDNEGKAILPGLSDAHCHFYGQAAFSLKADLSETDSWEKTIEKLVDFGKNKKGWLVGRGWDQNLWTPAEFPDNTLLNKAFPDRPVLITRVDGHAAIANSLALKLAGINAQSRVEGGKIELKNGKPTGLLIDNAVDLVKKIVPKPTRSEMIAALLNVQDRCFELGLTSLQDMGLDRATLEFFDSLYASNTLKVRLTAYALPQDRNWLFQKGKIERDHFSVIGFKVYADGALGSRGACLLAPYSDEPGNFGLMLASNDSLKTWFSEFYKNGFQVATHCIGDSATRIVLKLYSELLSENNNFRWRIEHAQVVADSELEIFRKLNVLPSVQPVHAISDMGWAGKRLGIRLPTAYRYQDLLQSSTVLPMGSDFPVESMNPLFGFHAAVARQSAENLPEKGFLRENALSRNQTLLGMSDWAAYAVFGEKRFGTLEKGKNADFIVLNQDIMRIEASKIRGTQVLATYLGGKLVYPKN